MWRIIRACINDDALIVIFSVSGQKLRARKFEMKKTRKDNSLRYLYKQVLKL